MAKTIHKKTIELKVEVEGGRFIASCHQLGVFTCGDTIEEVCKNLGDALIVAIGGKMEIEKWRKFLSDE